MRKRCQFNEKLRLHYGPYYQGLLHCYPVMENYNNPLIENYLEGLERVLQRVSRLNTRTLAIRIDLRYPVHMYPTEEMLNTNAVLSRFFRYFKRELEQAGTKYSTQLHYVWAREQDTSSKPHYHLLMLLNADAFRTLGDMSPSPDGFYDKQNTYHRLVRSWSAAMNLPVNEMKGLVQVCEDHKSGQFFVALLHKADTSALMNVFKVGSYLCKQATKAFNQSLNTFNTSRDQGG